MRKPLAAFTFCGLALCGAARPLVLSDATPPVTKCAPTDDIHGKLMLHELRTIVSRPEEQMRRQRYHLPSLTDTLKVQRIVDDSTCQRVGRLMNEAMGDPLATERRPYVAQVDTLVWGDDPTLVPAEFKPVFVFDRNATKILFRNSW